LGQGINKLYYNDIKKKESRWEVCRRILEIVYVFVMCLLNLMEVSSLGIWINISNWCIYYV